MDTILAMTLCFITVNQHTAAELIHVLTHGGFQSESFTQVGFWVTEPNSVMSEWHIWWLVGSHKGGTCITLHCEELKMRIHVLIWLKNSESAQEPVSQLPTDQ